MEEEERGGEGRGGGRGEEEEGGGGGGGGRGRKRRGEGEGGGGERGRRGVVVVRGRVQVMGQVQFPRTFVLRNSLQTDRGTFLHTGRGAKRSLVEIFVPWKNGRRYTYVYSTVRVHARLRGHVL